MKVYEQVEEYMNKVGLKYIKNTQDFVSGLAYRTKDKQYTNDVVKHLNSRAEGRLIDNDEFYKLKNYSLDASVYISAAFDGGVFRHIGNMIMDCSEMFSGKALDLGCDCGIVTCFVALCYPDVQFTGVDKNPDAIENAKRLAEKLGVNNAEFVCCDVYDFHGESPFDLVTSFRCLLDVAYDKAHYLPFIGLRSERENNYKEAFSDYAGVIADNLKDGGNLISVERYTADYGWLGWLSALEEKGIYASDGCELMKAQDISSVKEYSVTYAKKEKAQVSALDVFNSVLSKDFKSGAGLAGGMAEFALYYDADGEIEFTDVYKKDRIIHQFAFATSKSGKRMYYDAGADSKKLKYYNEKKEQSIRKDFDKKLSMFDKNTYNIKNYSL